MTRKKIDPSFLSFEKIEPATGNSIRQNVLIKQGIEREISQKIIKLLKSQKAKTQVAIQGDELRVSGKKRDDLQSSISIIKENIKGTPLQFINFRD